MSFIIWKIYLPKQFHQVERIVAEQYRDIDINLGRALEDKSSFTENTHPYRFVAIICVGFTIQLGFVQPKKTYLEL